MCEYLRMDARYNTADRRGETRRDINQRFGVPSPEFCQPSDGEYLLQWFRDASSTRRWEDGYPKQLTPPEWMAWQQMTGEQVRREEWAALRDMDHAYVGALASELSDQRAREAESNKNGRYR